MFIAKVVINGAANCFRDFRPIFQQFDLAALEGLIFIAIADDRVAQTSHENQEYDVREIFQLITFRDPLKGKKFANANLTTKSNLSTCQNETWI